MLIFPELKKKQSQKEGLVESELQSLLDQAVHLESINTEQISNLIKKYQGKQSTT